MNFIKIQIIKDWLFALVEDNDNYMILFGKICAPQFKANTEYTSIFVVEQIAEIILRFKEANKNLFTLIALHNQEEYDTIIKIAEVII